LLLIKIVLFITEFSTYEVKNYNKERHPKTYAGRSGSYLFTNIITNRQYVGSTVEFYTRLKDPILIVSVFTVEAKLLFIFQY